MLQYLTACDLTDSLSERVSHFYDTLLCGRTGSDKILVCLFNGPDNMPATRICIHCLSHLQFAQWRAGLIEFEWFDVDCEICLCVCLCEKERENFSEKLPIVVFDLSWQLATLWQFWLGAT